MKKDNNLFYSALFFLIVLCIWPVFMILCQVEGGMEDQFAFILENQSIHKLQFFFALLIAPTLLYLMAAVEKYFESIKPLRIRLGWVFFSAYLVLNSIAYASQIIILPDLLDEGNMKQAAFWSMNDPDSVIYFLNQLGYAFWAVGTLLFFLTELKNRGLMRYVSVLLLISSVLSLSAFVGLIVESPVLNSLTLISGLLLLPVAVLSLIWGYRKSRN